MQFPIVRLFHQFYSLVPIDETETEWFIGHIHHHETTLDVSVIVLDSILSHELQNIRYNNYQRVKSTINILATVRHYSGFRQRNLSKRWYIVYAQSASNIAIQTYSSAESPAVAKRLIRPSHTYLRSQ